MRGRRTAPAWTRTGVAVLATAAAAGVLVVAVPVARVDGAATPAARAAVQLRALPDQVLVGRPVAVAGTVRRAGDARRVRLQVRAPERWRTVERTPLRGGRFDATVTFKRPGTVRVRATVGGRSSAPRRVVVVRHGGRGDQVPTGVTLVTPSGPLSHGRAAVFAGAVRGIGAARAPVTVEALLDEGWTAVTATTTGGQGAFEVGVVPPRGGPTSFRATVRGVSSGPVAKDVLRWLDVPSQPFWTFSTDGRTVVLDSALVGGVRIGPMLTTGHVHGDSAYVFTAGQCDQAEVGTAFLDADRPGLSGTETAVAAVSGLDSQQQEIQGLTRRVTATPTQGLQGGVLEGLSAAAYVRVDYHLEQARAPGTRAVAAWPTVRCNLDRLPSRP